MQLRSESEGWAPLYRRIFHSDVWQGQAATTKVVLVWVLGRIRHTETSGTPAGAVDTTLDAIGRECNTTRNTTRNALAALEAVGFLSTTRTRWGIRVLVSSWRQWLACDNESNRHANQRMPAVTNESSSRGRDAQPLTGRSSTVEPPLITEEEEEGRSAASQQQLIRDVQPLSVVPVIGYRETIDDFHGRYLEAYKSKPTWRAAEGMQLKRLLATHGAEEVQRRIAVLFTAAPRWLRPPYTFMTLVKNFDALVVSSTAGNVAQHRGGLSPAEVMDLARRMGRQS